MTPTQEDIYRLLRGTRSQQKLNIVLGYSYNKYADWERGRVKASWDDFVDLARVLKLPLRDSIYNLYGIDDEPKNIRQHLSFFWGNKSQELIAKDLKMSRGQIQRLLNGSRKLEFETVLKIFDMHAFDVNIFVRGLIPEWRDADNKLSEKISFLDKISDFPWVEVVPRLISALKNQNTKGNLVLLLRKFTNENEEKIRSLVDDLIDMGILVGDENDKVESSLYFLDTSPIKKNILNVRFFWQNKILDYITQRRKKGTPLFWGYKIFACTPDQFEEIKKSYMTFYHSIDEILNKDPDNRDNVDLQFYVLNMQLVDLVKTLDIENELKDILATRE